MCRRILSICIPNSVLATQKCPAILLCAWSSARATRTPPPGTATDLGIRYALGRSARAGRARYYTRLDSRRARPSARPAPAQPTPHSPPAAPRARTAQSPRNRAGARPARRTADRVFRGLLLLNFTTAARVIPIPRYSCARYAPRARAQVPRCAHSSRVQQPAQSLMSLRAPSPPLHEQMSNGRACRDRRSRRGHRGADGRLWARHRA